MAALVGDLVDPDPAQPVDAIDVLFDVVVDPGDDRSNGAPRHPQQLTRRRLRGAHGEPCRHRVEVAGVTDTVTRPRHCRHRGTMGAATDPWRVGFDEHLRRAGVQRPPPPPPITVVIAWRASLAASAPAAGLRVRPDRHDDRPIRVVDTDPFHDRACQTARVLPYPSIQHSVCLPAGLEPSTARNLGTRRIAPADRPSTHPRIGQKSPMNARHLRNDALPGIRCTLCPLVELLSAPHAPDERSHGQVAAAAHNNSGCRNQLAWEAHRLSVGTWNLQRLLGVPPEERSAVTPRRRRHQTHAGGQTRLAASTGTRRSTLASNRHDDLPWTTSTYRRLRS